MTFEDFGTLTHISPALTNEKLTKALSDWFKEDVTFTHWEKESGSNLKPDSQVPTFGRFSVPEGTEGTPQTQPVLVRVGYPIPPI
ncbi:hypothetical protein RR48_08913 [Papilio machaon]|uniref:Uncharacterized protein n=1 Tax=Papilio machaon TaxID=76193 RepID=A0A194QVG7_PAPMA|nr:hypothetical protein RR48_08913 [Papilio machaon]